MPAVAVIVVTFNAERYITRCIDHLERQTRKADRVIIVDNASVDGTVSLIKRRAPWAYLIALSENIGFAAANNRAIQEAERSDLIALLNPDAFPRPTWLEALVKAAERFPEHGMFASALYDPRTGLIDGAGDVYHAGGLAWRRFHGFDPQQVELREEEVFAPCAAAALYRRSAVSEVGLFDESYFCYFEDVDLAFRLQLRGHICLFVPEAVVEHLGSASTGKRSGFAVYHGYRNLVWTFFKNMPWPYILWRLPSHLFILFSIVIVYFFRGKGLTILKAMWDAFRGLPRALKARKSIQQSKTVKPGDLRQRMNRRSIFGILREKRML